MEQEQDKQGKQFFWTTLPGILQGCAAIITAIGGLSGLFLVLRQVPNNREEPVETNGPREVVTQVQNNEVPSGETDGQETVDLGDGSGTVRNNMHTCPEGKYMVGAHFEENKFLCSNAFGSYQVSDEFVDPGDGSETVRHRMHACPDGFAVTGIHTLENSLSCAPLKVNITQEFVDVITTRRGMRACPDRSVILGIHVKNDSFLCGKKEEAL